MFYSQLQKHFEFDTALILNSDWLLINDTETVFLYSLTLRMLFTAHFEMGIQNVGKTLLEPGATPLQPVTKREIQQYNSPLGEINVSFLLHN